MQIVIDISNWLYNAIMECKEPLYSKSLGDAVRDGKPLPKGHGDLKDIAEIERLWQKGDYDSLASAVIFAPTVIEADKAGDTE